MQKEELVLEILETYRKVCIDQGVKENEDYRMGLKVGAEIMYENIRMQSLIRQTIKQ